MTRLIVAAIMSLALAGCGATRTAQSGGPVSAGNLPAPNAHRGGPTRPSNSSNDPVMGRDAASLIRQFGPPRLDLTEGAAHKLQFAGGGCILDAYLYAPRPGAEAVVTHIDTRSVNGDDVDRAACVAALQRR